MRKKQTMYLFIFLDKYHSQKQEWIDNNLGGAKRSSVSANRAQTEI